MPNPTRIVTKNLLASAMEALEGAKGTVRLSNIQDLCTLINLSMLHECVRTIGCPDERDPGKKRNLAPGYKRMSDEMGMQIVLDEPVRAAIVPLAQSRFMSIETLRSRFLKDSGNEVALGEAFRQSLDGALRDGPDYWSHFEDGMAESFSGPVLLSSVSGNFFLRSFIYLALASSEQMPLVPDAVRTVGVGTNAFKALEDIATRLEGAIKARYYEAATHLLKEGSKLPETPLAILALQKADGDRDKLLGSAGTLREGMSGPRMALETFSSRIDARFDPGSIKAKPHDLKSVDEARDDFDQALVEFRRTRVPIPGFWYDIKPAVKFAESTAKAVEIFAGATTPLTWAAALGQAAVAVPEIVADYKDFFSDLPNTVGDFMEIHRVCGLGLMAANKIDLEKMFGPIIEDIPDLSPKAW